MIQFMRMDNKGRKEAKMATKHQTITFKFDGANVSTDALGSSLLPLACQVYNLVQACSDEEARLLSVENNCVKFTFARTVVAAVALFGGVPDGVRDVAKYNAATRAINTMLVKREATLEVEGAADGAVLRFNGASVIPSLPEAHHDVKAIMAIYGELLDVGGVEPNIHIESDSFNDNVRLDVERDDARRLAKRLYSQVGVNAAVTIRDGKVISGKVLSVIDYEPEDMSEWLAHNGNNIGAEAFKGVNVAEFIEEQRI